MALPWALAVLSLLPLLDAQSLACPNFSVPITNASLDQISGKWFYIASAYRFPEYKKEAGKIHASFFYFTPNHTEDTILLREYMTLGDQCFYNSTILKVQRENATLSKSENDREHYGQLVLSKDPKTFMLASFPEDKQNMGLSFFADKPEVTPEQMQQFYDYLTCMGMDKSEVMYSDEKKNLCLPLEKQHDEERKKEKERSETGQSPVAVLCLQAQSLLAKSLSRISGKWFYIASAYRFPEYKKEASKIHASFFYFTPNHMEDTILLREYMTVGDQCFYNSIILKVQRENATLTKSENDTEHFRHLLLPKDPKTFMLASFPEDKQNMGLSIFADKPEVTPEQMEQFYDYLTCMGMDKSEVIYSDEKKNLCLPLEKQHDEERKKEKERSETDTAVD
ncbi:alpha-1-acid glycoprotein-like isoform X1 [Myotis yumanensis]|uniref:alpha-1-acid glycoprotein-like isoform X1 n=1 Tax=Myotis yumanensis TaxID=159337 RepID=UPI0038D3A363